MAQIKSGNASVVSGSNIVTGVGTDWIGKVQVGSMFIVRGESVAYDVAAVSDTLQELTLTGNYVGISGTKPYEITIDFTPNFNFPEINASDVDWPLVVTRTFRKIDAELASGATQHSHPNLSVLSQLGDSAGTLTYKGAPIEGGAGGDAEVSQNITVYGVNQGSYSNGNVIPAGTPLETVVKNMLQVIVPPTYTAPSVSISSNAGATSVEIGTTISPLLTATFNRNDAGTATAYNFKKNGTSIQNGMTTSVQDGSNTVSSALSYQVAISYNAGAVENDNMGNPYPTGQISAGTVNSNTITYTPYRKYFYGSSTATSAPITSAEVRALTGVLNLVGDGTTFTITIAAGARRIVIAYPASLGAISSVKYVELGNAEVKDTFILSTVSVEGANAYPAITYNVYTYISAVPFGDAATYTVTI